MLAPTVALAQDDLSHERERERGDAGVGVGLDYVSLSPGGAGASFGGFGVSIRHPIDPRVSIEGTIAAFRAQDATTSNPFAVRAYPVQASLLGYVWPHSPFRLYGIAGGTVERDTVDDKTTGRSAAFTRAGGHLGIGAELITGRLSWQADTRYIVYAESPTAKPGELAPPFTGNDAHMFRIGASMYF